MEYYMDEKSKLSKSESSSHSYSNSSKSSLMRSVSQKTSSNSKSSFLRSFSSKNTSDKSSLSRSSSQKSSNFTRKCGNLAKEQKAKFYIVKRCITMLVRWDKHGDS